MSTKKERACVILGAGGSFDVHDFGSVVNAKEWCPPLAKDLFNIDKHRNYRQILRESPGADFLAQQLAPQSKSAEFDIEIELRTLSQHHDNLTREHFKHIPPYLHDLIARCSRDYTARPSCYEQLAFRILADHPHETLFLTLNYDDMLERAINSFDSRMTFRSITDYVEVGRQANVVKLHGCINRFTLLGGPASSWESLVTKTDVITKPEDDDIAMAVNVMSTKTYETGGRAVCPVITAPLAGNDPNDLVCPTAHIEAAEEFFQSCRKFLVIGACGHDDDLMYLLNSSVPDNFRPILRIVGAEDVGQVASRFYKEVAAFGRVAKTVKAQPATYSRGFRNYVSGNGILEFLKTGA